MKKILPLVFSLLLFACNPNTSQSLDKIDLSQKYYNNAEIIELETKQDYLNIVADEESFILYVYNPTCYACGLFDPHLASFVEIEKIAVLRIRASVALSTNIGEYVSYTPSVLIFKLGQFYVMLDPTVAEDESGFTTSAGFTAWVYTYINKV
ncbi:MAG TPA: hypothetical protein VJZ31_02345 [Bacilli bacterium]|nr:hypothetical protein [Bacilli bacterium]